MAVEASSARWEDPGSIPGASTDQKYLLRKPAPEEKKEIPYVLNEICCVCQRKVYSAHNCLLFDAIGMASLCGPLPRKIPADFGFAVLKYHSPCYSREKLQLLVRYLNEPDRKTKQDLGRELDVLLCLKTRRSRR